MVENYIMCCYIQQYVNAFSALTLLVGRQEVVVPEKGR